MEEDIAMSVTHLKVIGWSTTDPILEVKVKCPNCGAQKLYTPTLDQLKKICDDYTIHRDANNNILWVEGNTRLLKCPVCGYTTSFKIAIHRNGTVVIFPTGDSLEQEWWRMENEL